MEQDPVCGMDVDPETALAYQHDGQNFHFCGQRCLDRFAADPASFLQGDSSPGAATAAPPGTIWTCPMHPEIRRDEPGPCPLCGMALGLATPMSIMVGVGRGTQAGVLYPAFGLLLSPIIASLAMSLSSVSVISNALRLRAVAL